MKKFHFLFFIIFVGILILFYFIKNTDKNPAPAIKIAVSDSPYSGGSGTVFVRNRESFAKPLADLPTQDLRLFTFGNKMFNSNWVQAPASVVSLDGLGPTFNRVSCSGCHFKDGRGRPPADINSPMNSMLIRLSVKGVADDGGPLPHPDYGLQLNPLSINNVPNEGQVNINYIEIEGNYSDGTKYKLRQPIYNFHNMNFGPLGDDSLFSPRVAPAVYGLGLLEAIPEDTILGFADEDDINKDDISGRPNYIIDKKGNKQLGRFGWKANNINLETQISGAALGDIGITTSSNPEQNCPLSQKKCRSAITGGNPEMSDMQFKKLIFYSRTLAVPARRDTEKENIKRGARLFEKADCSACHIPQMKTGPSEIEALSYQDIQPFTDLLLHDMGAGLSDNRPDYLATGNEWRTPPLWGIGLFKTVNGHTNYLHDGRARNIAEAILWHGGEAQKSKEIFEKMSKEEREDLLDFLNSL